MQELNFKKTSPSYFRYVENKIDINKLAVYENTS